jgi:hypothetical protein
LLMCGHNSYKAHPTKVKGIFIRRVQGVNLTMEKTLNNPTRFEQAFAGVPKEVWEVFDNPAELGDKVNALAKIA